MTAPTQETLIVMAILFFASLVRSTFGFGEALIAMPLLVFLIPVTEAAPLIALISMTVAIAIICQDWREIQLGSVRGLLLAGVCGMPLGILWLTQFDERAVNGLLAGVIVVFSTFALTRRTSTELLSDRKSIQFGIGFAAGLLGGAYNTYGPPLVVYGSLRGWSPRQFRATLQAFFLVAGTLIVPMHVIAGRCTRHVLVLYLWCLPVVTVTWFVGTRLNRRIGGHRFLRYVHVGLLLIAASLIAHLLVSEGADAPP